MGKAILKILADICIFLKKLILNLSFTQNLLAEFFGVVGGVLATLYIINRLVSWQQLKTQAPILLVSLEGYAHDFDEWSRDVMEIYKDPSLVPSQPAPYFLSSLIEWSNFLNWGSEAWSILIPNLETIVELYKAKRQKAVQIGRQLITRLNFIQALVPSFPAIVEVIDYLDKLCSEENIELSDKIKKWKKKENVSDNKLAASIVTDIARFLHVAIILNTLCRTATELYSSGFLSCLNPRWNPSKFSRDMEFLLSLKKKTKND